MEKKTIALAFCAILHEWLTPEQMQEVLRRNKTPQYINNGSCATHDFCDANQAVIDAYLALGHVTPFSPENDDPEYQMKMDQIEKDINEVSAMWDFARKHDFFAAIYQPNYAAATGDTLAALAAASSFMGGFTDDDTQEEPIDGDLDLIDAEIARLEGKGVKIAPKPFVGITINRGIVELGVSNLHNLDIYIIDIDKNLEEPVSVSYIKPEHTDGPLSDLYKEGPENENEWDKEFRESGYQQLLEWEGKG